jgi:hypothetical protein
MNVTNKYLSEIKSSTKIHAIKIMLNCSQCGRKWAIFLADEEELLNKLPKDWYVCKHCKNEIKIQTERNEYL